MRYSIVLTLLLMLAACSGTPAPVVPTLAILPSSTDAPTRLPSATPALPLAATASPAPTDAPVIAAAPTNTDTPLPTHTATPPPTSTLTLTFTPSPTGTDTPSPTATFTYTPSLTITNTITPTPSPTYTASPDLDGLGMLAMLSQRATILPPERLYNPETLTAVAYAAQTLIAGGAASAGTPPVPGGLPLPGGAATLPPSAACTTPPPGVLAGDPTVVQALGCPFGSVTTVVSAVQSFEHGMMIYVQASPGEIDVLTSDGRFRRFSDTWTEGIDPETGGETPPLGLIEPKRGFGKVWRSNLDVRGSLGWGVTAEQGAVASIQPFEHGRAIYLPTHGETYLLIDDFGGATGSWRSLPGGF